MNNQQFAKCSINNIELNFLSRTISQGNNWMQCIVYNSTNNTLIRGFVDRDDHICSLEKINYSNMQSDLIVNNLDYGHVNDITYNSNTNKLYLLPMFDSGLGKDRNLIYVLNSSTLAKEGEIHVGTNTNECISGIAYNEDNNKYYVFGGDYTIKVLNSSFEIVDSFNVLIEQINIRPKYAFQNLEIYDNKLFIVYSYRIICFDLEGNFIKQFFLNKDIETEGLAYIGNDEFIVGKINGISGTTIDNSLYKFDIFCDEYTSGEPVIKTVTINTGNNITSTDNYIIRSGNIVECGVVFKGLSSSGDTVLGTIPVGFRPKKYIRTICACSGDNFARFEINTNGIIKMNATSINNISTNHWFSLHVTYIVD